MQSRFVQVFLILLVLAAVGYIAFRPGQIPLVKLPEAPRPAPVADGGEVGMAFGNLLEPVRVAEEAELRKARNATVEAWRAALQQHKLGKASLRSAELVELKVWVVRQQVGEIEAPAMHAGVTMLFERELARMEMLAALPKPQVSEAALREGRAFLARERLLAGRPDHGYEQHRLAHQAALSARITLLRKLKPTHVQSAQDDLADFDRRCPPETTLREAAGLTELLDKPQPGT